MLKQTLKFILITVFILNTLTHALYSASQKESDRIRVTSLFTKELSGLIKKSEFRDGINKWFIEARTQLIHNHKTAEEFEKKIEINIKDYKKWLKVLNKKNRLFSFIKSGKLKEIKQYFNYYYEMHRRVIRSYVPVFGARFFEVNILNKVRNKAEQNLLEVAYEIGTLEIYKYLYERIFRSKNEEQMVDFIRHSIREGEINKENVNESKRYNEDNPYLYYAIRSGDIRLVEYLLSLGADPNAQCFYFEYGAKITMLHYVCENSDLKMVKLLMDYGAVESLHIESDFLVTFLNESFCEMTPFHLAVCNTDENNRREIVDYLINNYDLDVNLESDEKLTPMHFAVLQRDTYLINRFKDIGGDINRQLTVFPRNDFIDRSIGQVDSSILHYAAQKGDLGLIKYLVEELGMNINALNENNCAPIHIALFENRNFEVIEYFVKQGLDLAQPVSDSVEILYDKSNKKEYMNMVKYIVKYLNYFIENNKKMTVKRCIDIHRKFTTMLTDYDKKKIFLLDQEKIKELNLFVRFAFRISDKIKEEEKDLYDKYFFYVLEELKAEDVQLDSNSCVMLKSIFIRMFTDLFSHIETKGSSIDFIELLDKEKEAAKNNPKLRQDIEYLETKLRKIKARMIYKMFTTQERPFQLLLLEHGDQILNSWLKDFKDNYKAIEKDYKESIKEEGQRLEQERDIIKKERALLKKERERLEKENRRLELNEEPLQDGSVVIDINYQDLEDMEEKLVIDEKLLKTSEQEYKIKREKITEADVFKHYLFWGFVSKYVYDYENKVSGEELLKNDAVIYYVIDMILEYFDTAEGMADDKLIKKISKALNCESSKEELLFNLLYKMVEDSRFDIANFLVDIMLSVENGKYLLDSLELIKDKEKGIDYQNKMIDILEEVTKDEVLEKIIRRVVSWNIDYIIHSKDKKTLMLKHLLSSDSDNVKFFTMYLLEKKLKEYREKEYLDREYIDLLKELILINKSIDHESIMDFKYDADCLMSNILHLKNMHSRYYGKELKAKDDDNLDKRMYVFWLLKTYLDFSGVDFELDDSKDKEDKMKDEEDKMKKKNKIERVFDELGERAYKYMEKYYQENVYNLNQSINELGDKNLHVFIREGDTISAVQAIKQGASIIVVNNLSEIPGDIRCDITDEVTEVKLDITLFPEENNWMIRRQEYISRMADEESSDEESSEEESSDEESTDDSIEGKQVDIDNELVDMQDEEEDQRIGKKRSREPEKNIRNKKLKFIGPFKDDKRLANYSGLPEDKMQDEEEEEEDYYENEKQDEQNLAYQIDHITGRKRNREYEEDESNKKLRLDDNALKNEETIELFANDKIDNKIGEKRQRENSREVDDILDDIHHKNRKLKRSNEESTEFAKLFLEKKYYEFYENGIKLKIVMEEHERRLLDFLEVFFNKDAVRDRLFYKIYTSIHNIDNEDHLSDIVNNYDSLKKLERISNRLMYNVLHYDFTEERHHIELKECIEELNKVLVLNKNELEQKEILVKLIQVFPEIGKNLQNQATDIITKRQRLDGKVILTLFNFIKIEIHNTGKFKVLEPILDLSSIIKHPVTKSTFKETLKTISKIPLERTERLIVNILRKLKPSNHYNKLSLKSLITAS